MSGGDDTVDGGAGHDVYIIQAGGSGNSVISDSSGNDEIDFVSAEDAINGDFDTNFFKIENDLVVSFYQAGELKNSVTILGQFSSTTTPVIERLRDVNKQQSFVFKNTVDSTHLSHYWDFENGSLLDTGSLASQDSNFFTTGTVALVGVTY